MTDKRPIVVLAGPTASGKSSLAVELAGLLDGEIINADSQQVYKEPCIGTAKPGSGERDMVRHHLLDLASINDQLTAARFVGHADAAIADISDRGRVPLVVGGSGLWLRSLLWGLADAPERSPAIRARLEAEESAAKPGSLHSRLVEVDPETASRLHPNDKVRIIRALEVFEVTGEPLSAHHARHGLTEPRHPYRLLVLLPARVELRMRIRRRAESMLASGWVKETRALLEGGVPRDRLEKLLGYGETAAYLDGALTSEQMLDQIVSRTWAYAKRQVLWLRKEPFAEWWRPPVDARALAEDLFSWLRSPSMPLKEGAGTGDIFPASW